MTWLPRSLVSRFGSSMVAGLLVAGALSPVGVTTVRGQRGNEEWQASELIQPAELAAMLKAPNRPKPLIVFVGFDFLYRAGHIPGSINVGPGSRAAGLENLKRWASGINKNAAVVLYCGCCPWRHCPNVRPAFETARAAGLKHTRVLYLSDSLLRDWIDKGYPVAKGE